MRQKANEYLREGNCGLAAVWYRKALLNFDYCFPDSKVDREWFNASKLVRKTESRYGFYHAGRWPEMSCFFRNLQVQARGLR